MKINCSIIQKGNLQTIGKIFFYLIIVVLLFLIVNEIFLRIPAFQLGILKDNIETESNYKIYDVRKNDKEIQMLCYIGDISDEAGYYCFNTSEGEFEKVPLEVDKKQIYDEPLTLLTINENDVKTSVFAEKMVLIPKEDMIALLQVLTLEDFIVYEDTINNDVYINYHDYIRTQVFLLKYYKDELKDLTQHSNLLEELRTFSSINGSSENKFIDLYPANSSDIFYIYEIDKNLGERMERNSKALVELVYHDILYMQERGIAKEICDSYYSGNLESLYAEVKRLQAAMSFVKNNQNLNDSEKYNEIFTNYEKEILCEEGLPEKLYFMVNYTPLIDTELLNLFISLSGNSENEEIQLSNLIYYVCTNIDCKSYVQVVNLLNEYY